jgi:hypothetical protein
MDHHGADGAHIVRQPRLVRVGAESCMRVSDDAAFVTGDNQTGRIEVRLGKNQFVKFIAAQAQCGAAAQLTLVPQAKNVRRILVSEMSVFDHSTSLNDR